MSVLPFNLVEVDVIVDNAGAYMTDLTKPVEIIEVAIAAPVGVGIRQIETIPFTKQGVIGTTIAGTEFPIGPGPFVIDSIAARVATAPTGSSIILDVLKNGVTIFASPGDRPTIAASQNNATVGTLPAVMLDAGDYIECIIPQVGSSTPGSDLVVSIRLERLA